MYKQFKNSLGEVVTKAIMRTSDGACIPFDPANTDAQAFAKWLKDGGTPESAEDGGSVSAEWVAETIAKLLPNG
jgi:hypothetical protein